MAATFPGGVKVFTTKQAGDQIASAHINDLQDEVVAVETELKKSTEQTIVNARDSARLGGNLPTAFATADHNHSGTYLPVNGKAADSDKLDGKDSTEFELASVWQNWTPDCNGWSSYEVRKGRYRIQGETLFFLVEVRGVSNSTTATVDLPSGIVTSKQLGTAVYAFTGIGVDNGVSLANPMRGNIGNNTSTIVLYKDFAGANWTASGDKQVIFSGWCEIQ